MNFFSKIIYIFIATIILVPNSVFAGPAEYLSFDPSLTYNSSCKLVVTYDLKIKPISITTTPPPGSVFKFSVEPVDPVTDNPQTALNVDYPISVPANGEVLNGTIQTAFSEYQPYKLQIFEYVGGNFLDVSDPVKVTPAPCPQNSAGSGSVATTSSGSSTSFNIDIDNPISVSSISGLIQKVLEIMIKVGIPLLVVMIVYSGFLYLVARGNETKISEAHTMLTYTLIGGAILLGAWALAQLIHTTLIEITASIIQYFV